MNIITRDTIERWADTTFSESDLPYLISKLVRASTPKGTKINIPFGSSTHIGGWDGEVTCDEESAYVPKGISLWEMGTSKNPRVKAESDYIKRKSDPLGYKPEECVYVFVTPRVWVKKDKWIREKKAENHWKDVIVYDSVNLHQWFDLAPAVARWFSAQDGVGGYPFDGIITPDEFWEEWSIAEGVTLTPNSIISGREYEVKVLLNTLKGDPTIKGIKASTKDEAIAFIIASAKMFPIDDFESFFSKTLIVDTESNYRAVRINSNNFLNLIPRFENTLPLYAAVSKGHHVLVPLGADDDFNQETIILPTIDRDGQIDALVESGVPRENAIKFSKESARNITILKRLLGFPLFNRAKWFEKESIREIIPALLLGRWDESFSGDIELIERLSNQKYSNYSITLNKWKNFEESPIIQIGTTWRLTSPLDLWTHLSSQLTLDDFQNLKECIKETFDNKNQNITEENEDFARYLANMKRKYSTWSREGLIQSLILIGKLNLVRIPNLNNPQQWVDEIIYKLLYDAEGDMWISVDKELPLISEASPDSFVKAVKSSLGKDEPEIMDMFKEEDDFIYKSSHHTGLLWALEGLAWLPEYLNEASMILLTLSRLDPGGSIMNRPLNSLVEIFKPWHYQTLASFEERMEVLRYITKRERAAGWSLLIKLLPISGGFAQPTHKMRWRMFEKNTNLSYTYPEVFATHSAVLEMLISNFSNDEIEFSQIIERIPSLSPDERSFVLNWADAIYPKIKQEKFIAWKTIREILSHHRSHPDSDWALPQKDLEKLETLYSKLEPTDVLNKYIWLFNNHYPSFPEGFIFEKDNSLLRYEKNQTYADEARINAIQVFIKELGLIDTLELRKKVDEPFILGKSLAKVITEDEDILVISECLNDDNSLIMFVRGFFFQKSLQMGFDWIKTLFNRLQNENFRDVALSNILIPLQQDRQLWNFLSSLEKGIQKEYWTKMNPNFYNATYEEKITCIEMLLHYKRFFTVMDIAFRFVQEIPSSLLAEILLKAATKDSSEDARLDGMKIKRIFSEVYSRDDINRQTLVRLEWLYLQVFDTYGTGRNPKALEEELINNPAFLVDILKLIYGNSEDEESNHIEKQNIPEETKQFNARQAFKLLRNWKRIPGMSEDKIIDIDILNSWIDDTRKLATENNILEFADATIGYMLAQFPEESTKWVEERKKIFQVIDKINTEGLKSNYYSGMFNKRGFSTRGAFDGGDIEREHASYFEELEKSTRAKFPNVSGIFKNLKDSFLENAKYLDERAERDKLEY